MTPKSKLFFDKSISVFPGGVSHNIRFYSSYPIFTKESRGQMIWDEDNNQYVDYWMGHGALILGHSPIQVVNAVKNQIENGTIFGTANEIALRLGEVVCKCVPCSEQVRFCTTGTEATMYGVRLARAYTGKRIIIKVSGGWHGYNSDLLTAVGPPFNVESAGVEDASSKTIVVPFNDLDAAKKVINENRKDLACFVVEPILGGGLIPATSEYLKGLREETERVGCLLFFDEVITGFRLALGGAQQFYDVKPDICTLGKILGGGLPASALTGKKEVMALADLSMSPSKDSRAWIGGGTFSANPSMATGLATLNFLVSNTNKIYPSIERLGKLVRQGVDRAFSESGIISVTTGVGSLFLTHFPSYERKLLRAEDLHENNKELQLKFYLSLMTKGHFFLPGHFGSTSYSHKESNILQLIESVTDILNE